MFNIFVTTYDLIIVHFLRKATFPTYRWNGISALQIKVKPTGFTCFVSHI